MNLRLRPLVVADARWCDGWLSEAAARDGYGASSCEALLARASVDRRLWLQLIERDDAAAGLLVARLGTPARGSATIEWLATAPGCGRRGSGMAAAAAAEDELRRLKVHRLYAPARHGIAVYFWLRLGYRPLLRAHWPCECEGIGWMLREPSERP
ncbi:MAG: hypothetical protein IVW36_04115 [Dehalococcoidia bacterium]|nr:hypothetical protein [Dehalococcoidia bacterium]